MKKQQEFKRGKLTLNKETIVSLNENQLNDVLGAGTIVQTCAGATCATTADQGCNTFNTPLTCSATCCTDAC